ncbi:MAG: hypothetical protein LBV47_09070 [Bacteroidales bacterium]|jgi:hypothetical protein|nr:hypothetical protein [Bacteroidales bacterium]
MELNEIIMTKNFNEPLVHQKYGKNLVQVKEGDSYSQETETSQEDELFIDFGELNDYTKIFGEMDNL